MKAGIIQLKMDILEAGVKKHEGVIEDFRTRIKQILATDGNVNEEEYDSQTQSIKQESATEVSLLSDQLEFANHELTELRRLEWDIESTHQAVAFGTVVVTDRDTFFVSTSIERFSACGKSIFGLSVQSPLYKVMKGKKVGDSFTYNKKKYTIKEIL